MDGITYSFFSCSQGLGPPELFSVPDQFFEMLLVSGSSWGGGAAFTGTCTTGGGRGLCCTVTAAGVGPLEKSVPNWEAPAPPGDPYVLLLPLLFTVQ